MKLCHLTLQVLPPVFMLFLPDLPTVKEVRGFNAEELNGFLKRSLNDIDNHIDTLTAQEVDGSTFLDFTATDFERWGIPGGPSKRIE
ncbi:18257_t:CDS:2, partial [Acaulospora morrowiae]